jgi:signal transduction histidine kinase
MAKRRIFLSWVPLAVGVWAIIFGTYEIIERTILKNASPNLLHVLHITRGTVTSFLIATIVAWYIIKRGGIESLQEKQKSPVSVDSQPLLLNLIEIELEKRLGWLIRLRWVAIGSVLVTIGITSSIFKVLSEYSVFALFLITVAMIGYNLIFYFLLKKVHAPKAHAFAQVLLDLVSLTLMLHFSGGIENPFFAFFVFHVIIGSILLRKYEAYLIGLITCLLFCGMVILEHTRIINHYSLLPFQNINAQLFAPLVSPHYIFGILFAFVATALFSVYFTTTIMENLRQRQFDLQRTGEMLAQEIKRMKEVEIQLVQAGKMVAVGQLASGIAHEINNPLATVAASAELLKELAQQETLVRLKEFESFPKHLNRIEEQVYRCKEIIQTLLGFSRKEDAGLVEVKVSDVLDETLKLVHEGARARGQEIICLYKNGLPSVQANPRQLQQVFLNILMNAIDAMDGGGSITIRAYLEGQNVAVEIADNGRGILPEHLPNIFDPFWTTKPPGKGTGLGLYLVHQIIQSQKGNITVKSEAGKGSIFTVHIPCRVTE